MNGVEGKIAAPAGVSPAQQLLGSIEECREKAGIIADRLDVLESRLLGEHPRPTTEGGLKSPQEQGFYGEAAGKIQNISESEARAMETLTRIEQGTSYE